MVDLTRHTTPDWYVDWVRLYYVADSKAHQMRCLRCNTYVWHLTRHAVSVHGDPIPVVPVSPEHVAHGLTSDPQGRLVANLTSTAPAWVRRVAQHATTNPSRT